MTRTSETACPRHVMLGYPSQGAAVRALGERGVDDYAIAEKLGIHVNVVRARLGPVAARPNPRPRGKPGSRGKATAGHPTQRAAILALHAEGLAELEIAVRLDLPASRVRARIHESGRALNAPRRATSNVETPAPAKPPGRPVELPAINEDVLREMRPHAAARGISCLRLASLILDTVVSHRLIDAVLDDREGRP